MAENPIVQYEKCDFVFNEEDYPLRKYLIDLEIVEEKADEIVEFVINKIIELYHDKLESALLEIDVKKIIIYIQAYIILLQSSDLECIIKKVS